MGNVRFFDDQPLGALADSLAACDVAAVCIEPGADRLAMPSKLVGILASGRPVLALAPAGSELAQLVESSGCGVVVADFNNPQAVADAIRTLRADRPRTAAMAHKARELATTRFALVAAADKYEAVIRAS
jgi:colanic acid biosynthesis glycosyl transferase WcaI